MLLSCCSYFPRCHDSLLPSVIELFHKVFLNGSVSIPGSCVRITCKIQMNKIADAFIKQGRPESKLTLYVLPVKNEGDALIIPVLSLEQKTVIGWILWDAKGLGFCEPAWKRHCKKATAHPNVQCEWLPKQLLTKLCLFWEGLLAVVLPMCWIGYREKQCCSVWGIWHRWSLQKRNVTAQLFLWSLGGSSISFSVTHLHG